MNTQLLEVKLDKFIEEQLLVDIKSKFGLIFQRKSKNCAKVFFFFFQLQIITLLNIYDHGLLFEETAQSFELLQRFRVRFG